MHLTDLDQLGWWVIFVALAEIALLLAGVIWALLQAAHLPAPVLLVMAITLVTFLILMVYVVTRTNEVLTLAGVPIGALVTAATGVFKGDLNAMQRAVDEVTLRLDAQPPPPPPPATRRYPDEDGEG